MATSLLLDKLPQELRTEIYRLVVSDFDIISLVKYETDGRNVYNPNTKPGKTVRYVSREVVLRDHERDRLHRREIWDPETQNWIPAPPTCLSLLQVSKQLHAEVLPVVYGDCKFELFCMRTLSHFMDQIGPGKEHLRHLVIRDNGWLKRKAVDQAIASLRSIRGLRTLEISHFDICFESDTHLPRDTGEQLDILAQMCLPLLKSLKIAYKADGLARNVLDVVKIALPEDALAPCVQATCLHPNAATMGFPVGCQGTGTSAMLHGPRQRFRTYLGKAFEMPAVRRPRHCECAGGRAGSTNDTYNEMLKERFAIELGLAQDPQESKDGENEAEEAMS